MRIKFYIKNNLKSKVVIFAIILFLVTLSLLGIPFYSHKTDNPENEPESTELPIIMYHMILENPKVRNRFTISTKTFEEDLKYIKDNGYTTILIKDLIDYTENKKELPARPILLTFDDGSYNNYLYAFPLAKKYNAKFVFSPIGREADRFTENIDENEVYSYASWSKIIEMSASELVEIQNHTYNMHSNRKPRIGCTKKNGEPINTYKEKLTKDILKQQKLIKEKTSYEPTAFFYPFGAYSDCSEEIIKSLGFKATFICESKLNIIRKNPACLFKLCRFLRPPAVSTETFFGKFKKITL